MPATEPTQQDAVDKRHLLLNQLTPTIELKVLGNYAITIPFNYITNFEFDVAQMQAHLELFDSSFYIIDTFAFILAQLSGKGVPIKMRWGYAFNSSVPTITNERIQEANQSLYMSKEYDLVVMAVESRPEEKGSTVIINFVISIFDPVLTSVPVKKVFVSGDVASINANATDLKKTLIEKWKKEGADGEARAKQLEVILKQVEENSTRGEDELRKSLEGKFGPNVEIISNKGKLTFTEIYFRLMKIAHDQQNNLGFNRKSEWVVPLPVFPPEFDNNQDFLVFNCNNENVWSNLQRLASMMISKSTEKGKEPQNFAQNGTQLSQTEERFKMVGGKFIFHTSQIDNPILGASLYKEAGTLIQTDGIPPSQRSFCVWQFVEAPYEVSIFQEPIAYYKYHAGDPTRFDPNNLTEVIEFSAEFNNASKYFMALNGFGLQSMRNVKTGAEVNVSGNDAMSAEEVRQRSLQTTNLGGANNDLISQSSGTDPSQDNQSNNGFQSVSASPDQSTQKRFDVPAQIVPDRDAENLKNFNDAIKSSVANSMAVFGADMQIMGDPKFDALFMGNKMIYFEYINKQGDINPIYTGHYVIKNIKHAISSGKYTTSLSLLKQPESTVNRNNTENSFVNATNVTQGFGKDAGTEAGVGITTAQISVFVVRNGNKWKVQTVSAYEAPEYKDTARVDKLIINDKEGKIKAGANKIIESINSDKFEDLLKQAKGKIAVQMTTKQEVGTGIVKDYDTKFVMFNIDKAI